MVAVTTADDLTLSAIEKRLKSQKTFEAALKELQGYVLHSSKGPAKCKSTAQLKHVLKRIIVLLKSRYSSTAFWQAANEFFLTCQAILGRGGELGGQIDDGVRECQNFLRASDIPIQSHTASLFEGQLSNEAEHEAQEPSRTVEQILSQLFASRLQSGDNDANQQSNTEMNEQMMRELEEQQIAAMTEMGMLEEGSQNHVPPASKRAVKRLKQVVLDQKKVDELRASNNEAVCSICQEDFAIGETMSVMPCSSHHSFHPLCLKPWLSEHNSCPICRFELETDDMQYEAKKQRRKEDEEGAKGSANAQSHNEYLYI